MELDDVLKIIKLMNEHGLSEIEIEDEEGKIRLRKGENGENIKEIISVPQVNQGTGQAGVDAGGDREPQSVSNGESGAEEDVNHINAPLVGTFYSKPDPESEPFVKVGEHVDEETVVCIIEAMKVMNDIKAECSGTIKKVLVEDAHPVEFDQPIFEIEPD